MGNVISNVQTRTQSPEVLSYLPTNNWKSQYSTALLIPVVMYFKCTEIYKADKDKARKHIMLTSLRSNLSPYQLHVLFKKIVFIICLFLILQGFTSHLNFTFYFWDYNYSTFPKMFLFPIVYNLYCLYAHICGAVYWSMVNQQETIHPKENCLSFP